MMVVRAPASKPSASRADERLLVEAAREDPARFAELYEIHFERVYLFIVRRVGDRAPGPAVSAGRGARLCAAAEGGALMDAAVPRLEVAGLTKRYGGLVAVNDVGLSIRGGEILGLIGPNGSGKSTVIKLIMGIERPNAGTVRLEGTDVAGWPTYRISRSGVGIVFQHSRPLNRQTVLENIKLALLPDSLFRLAVASHVEERARAIAERVGLGGVLDRRPPTLPFADLRRLEMAKALARDPKVVLLDEPFAGLTAGEMAGFAELIDGFRRDGRAVLLVDHNVKSVARLVDRVMAMYLGERIAEGTAEQVMQDPTVRRVYIGGEIAALEHRDGPGADKRALLELDELSVLYGKAQALDKVRLRVNEGEFVSIVGLNGAGKTTLFNAVSGLVPYAGSIRFGGRSLAGMTPASIARAGVVQCPETRELFGDMSVRENLDLGGQHLPREARARQLAWLLDLFPILRERAAQVARTLSGGEQQMLTIARALMMQPKLLILDEPTLGLAPVILEQLSKALERLRQSTDITVLLGEQNVTFALPHADRVYLLEHARIIWEGPPARFAAEMGTGYL
jgi:ABC-type branched-subunit amino acid transport system ATPase component